MQKSIVTALLAVSTLCIALATQAQYVGPTTQTRAHSVAEILRNPVDDQKVVLKGYILKEVGKNRYMFSDGTGEIRVEINRDRFPLQRVDEKTMVELSGEVETEFMKSPEIEVDLISIVK